MAGADRTPLLSFLATLLMTAGRCRISGPVQDFSERLPKMILNV